MTLGFLDFFRSNIFFCWIHFCLLYWSGPLKALLRTKQILLFHFVFYNSQYFLLGTFIKHILITIDLSRQRKHQLSVSMIKIYWNPYNWIKFLCWTDTKNCITFNVNPERHLLNFFWWCLGPGSQNGTCWHLNVLVA